MTLYECWPFWRRHISILAQHIIYGFISTSHTHTHTWVYRFFLNSLAFVLSEKYLFFQRVARYSQFMGFSMTSRVSVKSRFFFCWSFVCTFFCAGCVKDRSLDNIINKMRLCLYPPVWAGLFMVGEFFFKFKRTSVDIIFLVIIFVCCKLIA